MAGDWIKFRTNLSRDPAVVGISSRIKRDILHTLGALSCVWGVFDEQTTDGILQGYTPEHMDMVIGSAGFSDAMISVGWLIHDERGLVMPNFDRHNGQSAKTRLTNAARQKVSRSVRDKTVTREEKRREDIKPLSSGDDQGQLPGTDDQAEPVPTKQKSPKGSRWKSDEPVPTEWLDDAMTKGMNLSFAKLEAEKFVNYWTAATGAKAVKADWRATWRNWVLSALARAGANGQPAHQQPKTPRAFGA